jgi:hypothetical protein
VPTPSRSARCQAGARRPSGRAANQALLAALLVAAGGCHLVLPHRPPGGQDREAGARDGATDRARDALLPPDLGCLLGTSANGQCRTFPPSNPAAPQLDCPGATVISTLVVIDTDLCSVPLAACASSPPTTAAFCVIQLGSLHVTPAGTLRARGGRPLILTVLGAALVEGLIDVGGHGVEPGPGGATGGIPGSVKLKIGADGAGLGKGVACHCPTESDDDCGGSGAGYGSKGAQGGEDGCNNPGQPGGAYGQAALVPLLGGSGGASGAEQEKPGPAGLGGAGGGALQLSAQGGLWVKGAIAAGGGGGQGSLNCSGCSLGSAGEGGGGGGGSGGGILLEAPLIKGGGWIAANGGGGGGGSIFGAGGAGEDGRADGTPARGGEPVSGPPTDGGAKVPGRGGDGAAGSKAAIKGSEGNSHGGGGGGLGRIRLRTSSPYGAPDVLVSGVLSSVELALE